MGFKQYVVGKWNDLKQEWRDIKTNFSGLPNNKQKALHGTGGAAGGLGGAELGILTGYAAQLGLHEFWNVFPMVHEYFLPVVLGATGTYYGVKTGVQNWKAGGALATIGTMIMSQAKGLFTKPGTVTVTNDRFTPTEVMTLEGKLGETGQIDDFDVVKDLVKPGDGKFWSSEQVYDLDVKKVDMDNSNINYTVNEKGQMSLDVDIAMKDGTKIVFDGDFLSPADTRAAYAVANGHELVHTEDGKAVGDARVYFAPSFDLQNFSIERAIGAEDVKLIEKQLGVEIDGDNAKLRLSWDSEAKDYKYEIMQENGDTLTFEKDVIVNAFNLVEDGDLDRDYFSGKQLERLEDAVTVWNSAQDALKKEWKPIYDIGVAASEYGFAVDSDWQNLSTPEVLANYLTKNFENETKEAGIDLENLTWEQGMGWIAMFAGQQADESYYNWLLDKAQNDPAVADKYNWSQFAVNKDRDALIGKYASLTNQSAQDFANNTYLTWLRDQAKTKFPGSDVDWDSLDKAGVIKNFYDLAYGLGDGAGYKGALDTLLGVLSLTDAEFAKADEMDGKVDGDATIENLISVYEDKVKAGAFEDGYNKGLQNYRITHWMEDTTAPYLAGQNASARNDTITEWMHNADTYTEYGWDYVVINSNSNISAILNAKNQDGTSRFDNKTKEYIRSAINAGDYIIALNTANEEGDAKNQSYFQRFNAKTRTVANDGIMLSDKDYTDIKTYAAKGDE